MSGAAWLVFLVVTVPVVGFVVYLFVNDSFYRVAAGRVGLLTIRGKATDKALLPGPHFVPAFRRMDVLEYPSLELSYRATDEEAPIETEFERVGPALRAKLGDRASVMLAYTIRFRIEPDSLRSIHERFGSSGIWSAVRDLTSSDIRSVVSDPTIGVDDLYGSRFQALEATLGSRVAETLAANGFVLMLMALGDPDLGSTGEVVQATVRSRLELEREEAEAPVRLARARNDAELQPYVTGDVSGVALRYRENEAWRDLAHTVASHTLVVPSPTRPVESAPTPELTASAEDGATDEA